MFSCSHTSMFSTTISPSRESQADFAKRLQYHHASLSQASAPAACISSTALIAIKWPKRLFSDETFMFQHFIFFPPVPVSCATTPLSQTRRKLCCLRQPTGPIALDFSTGTSPMCNHAAKPYQTKTPPPAGHILAPMEVDDRPCEAVLAVTRL